MDAFQKLYDSEINFAVSCLWDGGFDVKLGDAMNGFKAEANVKTWVEIGDWLDARARELYPESRYTRGEEVP